jgi:tetratricopeptide (TPR) repeat protein
MWFAALLILLFQTSEPLELAWQLAARGDRGEAEAVLRKLLASDGTNTDAHLLYGNLLAEDGDKEGALAELNIAVRQRPHSAEAWNSLGETCNRFKKKREALDAFNKAVLADPEFGIAQSNLAQSLYEAGQKDAAKNHALRAMALLGRSKDAADAIYVLGKLELNAGEPRKAADYLSQVVQMTPDFASAWSDLGQAKKLLLDDSGAIAAFSQAAKLDPNDAVAQYRLGAEYLRQDKPAESLGPLEAAARANVEDQSTLNALATAYQRLGRLEEAAQTRRKLSEVIRHRDLESQNALSALRLNNQGAELEKAGKLKDALDLYKQAVSLNGKHAGIRSNYAVALLRLGQWRNGLEELKLAQDLDPENKGIETALNDAISQAPESELPDWARSARVRRNQTAPSRKQGQ